MKWLTPWRNLRCIKVIFLQTASGLWNHGFLQCKSCSIIMSACYIYEFWKITWERKCHSSPFRIKCLRLPFSLWTWPCQLDSLLRSTNQHLLHPWLVCERHCQFWFLWLLPCFHLVSMTFTMLPKVMLPWLLPCYHYDLPKSFFLLAC